MKRFLFIVTFLFTSLSGQAVFAQDNAESAVTNSFEVSGTSTIHDWTMTSEDVTLTATVDTTENGFSLSELTGTIPVESLKSGKGKMDKNAYEALKKNKFPGITFQLTSPLAFQAGETVATEIDVTIAGNTQKMPIEGTINQESNNLTITGAKTFKMTSVGVEPPSLMFGSIKTGDEITVAYSIQLDTNQ